MRFRQLHIEFMVISLKKHHRHAGAMLIVIIERNNPQHRDWFDKFTIYYI